MTLAKRHSDDWETHPIGTGKRLAELEAALVAGDDHVRRLSIGLREYNFCGNWIDWLESAQEWRTAIAPFTRNNGE